MVNTLVLCTVCLTAHLLTECITTAIKYCKYGLCWMCKSTFDNIISSLLL